MTTSQTASTVSTQDVPTAEGPISPPVPELSKNQQKKAAKEAKRLADLERATKASSDTGVVPAVAEGEAPLAVGLELLCESFEDQRLVMGVVRAIDGDEVMLALTELGRVWPIDVSMIDLHARTWTHDPEEYTVAGEDPEFDALYRVPTLPIPQGGAEAPSLPGRVQADRLADLAAPLVNTDGTRAKVPTAEVPPRLAKPEPIALAARVPERLVPTVAAVLAKTPDVAPTTPVLHAAPTPANPAGILCRVKTTGSIGGRWTRESDGKTLFIAHHGEVGYFDPANVAKFTVELEQIKP